MLAITLYDGELLAALRMLARCSRSTQTARVSGSHNFTNGSDELLPSQIDFIGHPVRDGEFCAASLYGTVFAVNSRQHGF